MKLIDYVVVVGSPEDGELNPLVKEEIGSIEPEPIIDARLVVSDLPNIVDGVGPNNPICPQGFVDAGAVFVPENIYGNGVNIHLFVRHQTSIELELQKKWIEEGKEEEASSVFPITDLVYAVVPNSKELPKFSKYQRIFNSITLSSGNLFVLFCARNMFALPIVDVVLTNISHEESLSSVFSPIERLKLDYDTEQDTSLDFLPISLNMRLASVYPSAGKAYAAVTLDRFPHENTVNPLLDGIPTFCMPDGLVFQEVKDVRNTKPPRSLSMFAFMLTDAVGARTYCLCATFYELRCFSISSQFSKRTVSSNLITTSMLARQDFKISESAFWVPKCVCLISHYPMYSPFFDCLNLLMESVFDSSCRVPVERFISYLLEIPVPPRGHISVEFRFFDHQKYVTFLRPPPADYPLAAFSLLPLFHALELDNILTIFAILLTERKVIFHCDDYALLTPTIEAICSLLFPLRWQHVLIPVCPMLLTDFLQAPMPFIIGIRTSNLNFDSVIQDVYLVDLDNNRIQVRKQRRRGSVPVANRLLPDGGMPFQGLLMQRLKQEASHLFIPNYTLMDISDHPYRESASSCGTNRTTEQLRMDALRDTFLLFFVNIFKDYRNCLREPTVENVETFYPSDLNSMFDMDRFLLMQSSEHTAFYKQLLETQAFTRFIEQRSEFSVRDDELFFFDRAVDRFMSGKDVVERADAGIYRSFKMSEVDITGLDKDVMNNLIGIWPTFRQELFSECRPQSFGLGSSFRHNTSLHDSTAALIHLANGTAGQVEDGLEPISRRRANSLYNYMSDNDISWPCNTAGYPPPITVDPSVLQVVTSPKSFNGNGSLGNDESVFTVHASLYGLSTYNTWFYLFSYYIMLVSDRPELDFCFAYVILDRSYSINMNADEKCYRHLLKACAVKGLAQHAKMLFKIMNSQGVRPNAITTGLFVKAVAGSSGKRSVEANKNRSCWFTPIDHSDLCIISRNHCPNCNLLISDERIMMGWGIAASNTDSNESNSSSGYKSLCDNCDQFFLPELRWGNIAASEENLDLVPFLSPIVIAREVEISLSNSDGTDFLISKSKLLKKNSALYVNLTYFFQCFKMPWSTDAFFSWVGPFPVTCIDVLAAENQLYSTNFVSLHPEYGVRNRVSESEITEYELSFLLQQVEFLTTPNRDRRRQVSENEVAPAERSVDYVIASAATSVPIKNTPKKRSVPNVVITSPSIFQGIRRASVPRPISKSISNESLYGIAGSMDNSVDELNLTSSDLGHNYFDRSKIDPRGKRVREINKGRRSIGASETALSLNNEHRQYDPSSLTLTVNVAVNGLSSRFRGLPSLSLTTDFDIVVSNFPITMMSCHSRKDIHLAHDIVAALMERDLTEAVNLFLSGRIRFKANVAYFSNWFVRPMFLTLFAITSPTCYIDESEFAQQYDLAVNWLKPNYRDEFVDSKDSPPTRSIIAFRSALRFIRPKWEPPPLDTVL